MSETQQVPGSIKQLNLRFLAQGMIKVDPREAPENLATLTPQQVWEWAQQYFSKLTRQQLLDGVTLIDIEEDTMVDCVEVQDEEGEYDCLVHSQLWKAFLWDARQMATADPPGTARGQV